MIALREISHLRSVQSKPFSVFVIDRATLGRPIADYLRFLRDQCPTARSIVLDKDISRADMRALLAKGAHGFLLYNQLRQSLSPAIRSVAKGCLWVNRRVLEECVLHEVQEQRRGVGRNSLTARQRQIIELVSQRLTNKEISSRLGISESTVKFHLAKIFVKLGVLDRYSVFPEYQSQDASLETLLCDAANGNSARSATQNMTETGVGTEMSGRSWSSKNSEGPLERMRWRNKLIPAAPVA
jgi:DNA-binding NarL/FixJ family response regulator